MIRSVPILLLLATTLHAATNEFEPIDIGSRLELFVDDYLIDKMQGVTRKLHPPQRREVVMTFDRPWEGNHAIVYSLFQDGDMYRMYYRGRGTCYAESKDGIQWTRPNLRLIEFKGSKENNILDLEGVGITPFKDTNPDCPPEKQYKALAGVPIRALASSDGLRWQYITAEPVIPTTGDRGGLAFYDTVRGEYRAYIREWVKINRVRTAISKDSVTKVLHEPHPLGVRTVCTATSKDFIHWTRRELCNYGLAPVEHLYTNATIPYFRAPHIFLSFPKRFMPNRKKRAHPIRPGLSDGVFMSSRDGVNFDRSFMEAWIRPGLDQDNWTHRNILIAWTFIQTSPAELSFYWTEHYYLPGKPCQLRRGTVRTDGFVSVNAPYSGGEFATKALTFAGRELVLNYSTSAPGCLQVEIQNADGQPIDGFALTDCPEIFGDELERVVVWKGGSDVSKLAGQPIRLRFVLKDADLYSLRFRP